jgi:DNA (cytosine-5)-methyltransferase 1
MANLWVASIKSQYRRGRALNVLDLFSGIGGFSLGLERAGMRTVAFCEIEPYARAVLRKHWPNVRCYDDVRTITSERLKADGIVPDVICGGFPCQDISWAGQGAGLYGERSGLWAEFARIIGEVRPQYAILENSAALLCRGLGDLLRDLAGVGYDAEWHCISSADIGAPHARERLWLVAYPTGVRQRQLRWLGSEIDGAQAWNIHWPGDEPPSERMAPGLPNRVERVVALGNSLLPQISELIGRAIMNLDQEDTPTLCMPAPWRHVPWHIEEAAAAVRDANGDLVCTTSSDELARLIAATPDLLAACDALVCFCLAQGWQGPGIDAGNAALVKARTGRALNQPRVTK